MGWCEPVFPYTYNRGQAPVPVNFQLKLAIGTMDTTLAALQPQPPHHGATSSFLQTEDRSKAVIFEAKMV